MLTKIKSDAKIKEKEIFEFDQEGNIKKIRAKNDKVLNDNNKVFDISSFSIGYYLVTPIIVGVFLGLGLDNWLNTKPVFFIIFLMFGTVASFYNIFKLTKER